MISQVTIDQEGYVTALSEGGYIEGGVDVSPEALEAVDAEKIGAYRLDENGGLVFDPGRWAEIQARIQQELENAPPNPEERIAELEAMLDILLYGGAV